MQAHGFAIGIEEVGTHGDMDPGAPMTEAPEEMGGKGVLADPIVGRIIEVEGEGHHVDLFLGGHPEHPLAEGQHLMPGVGGAFGEDEDGPAVAHLFGDLVQGALPVLAALAVDEEDAAEVSGEPDERPGSHFLLGHGHGQHIPHDQQGIDVGAMVTHIDGREVGYAPFPVDPDPQCDQDHADPQSAHPMPPPTTVARHPAAEEQHRDDQGHQAGEQEGPQGGQDRS